MSATERAGLIEDAPDHRLHSQTTCLNPFLRFPNLNMNTYTERYLFPMAPFVAQSALHGVTKRDLAGNYAGLWDVYCATIPALIEQRKDLNQFVARHHPQAA